MKRERKALEVLKSTYGLVYVLVCFILLVDLFIGLSFLPMIAINIIGNTLSVIPAIVKTIPIVLGFISK